MNEANTIAGASIIGADEKAIYLDHQATTPMDARVLDAMLPFFSAAFGNPHSSRHSHGIDAMAAVQEARGRIASLIGARPDEIVFTSGATEANNLAIKGAMARSSRRGLTTLSTEHHAVLDVARSLSRKGVDLAVVGVQQDGLVDVAALAAAVDDRTALISVMAANNEIGVLQPLEEIAAIARRRDALFHTDAAQAVGKVPLDVAAIGVDLMSISAHKLYGPMGIGALFVARRAAQRIEPLIEGGGQEMGFRSGTLPAALCVGFGEACRIAHAEMEQEASRLGLLREAFVDRLRQAGTDFAINGSMERRIAGNLNISFAGVDAEALLMRLRGKLSVASGSACTSDSLDPSHVVVELGYGVERAEEAIRVGFGRTTTMEETLRGADILAHAVARLARVGYDLRKGAQS